MSIMRFGKVLRIVAASCLIALSYDRVVAQSTRGELSIAPGTVEPGAVAKVPIQLNSSKGMGALQFELVFDPASSRFSGIENGPLLSAALVESNVVEPGRARVALVSNEPIQGAGVLLVAEFEVLAGPDGPLSFGLEAVRGWDQADNLPMNITGTTQDWTRTTPARTEAGKLDAAPEGAGAEVRPWLYGGAIGLALLFMVAYLLRRKNIQR